MSQKRYVSRWPLKVARALILFSRASLMACARELRVLEADEGSKAAAAPPTDLEHSLGVRLAGKARWVFRVLRAPPHTPTAYWRNRKTFLIIYHSV